MCLSVVPRGSFILLLNEPLWLLSVLYSGSEGESCIILILENVPLFSTIQKESSFTPTTSLTFLIILLSLLESWPSLCSQHTWCHHRLIEHQFIIIYLSWCDSDVFMSWFEFLSTSLLGLVYIAQNNSMLTYLVWGDLRFIYKFIFSNSKT